MEATAPGTGNISSETHVQILALSQQARPRCSRPSKHTRSKRHDLRLPAAVARSSRPRTLGMSGTRSPLQLLQPSAVGGHLSTGSSVHTAHDHAPFLGRTPLATPTYDDAHLRMSSAYHDPRLHDTRTCISTDPSGSFYTPAGSFPTRIPDHLVGVSHFSIQSPSAMSTASARFATETNLASATPTPSTNGDVVGRLAYIPNHQHSHNWPESGPSERLSSQPDYLSHPPLQVPHPLPQLEPQTVPPSFVEGGLDYHNCDFLLQPQAGDMSAAFETTLPAGADPVLPGQPSTGLSAQTLGETQPSVNTGGHVAMDHQPQRSALFSQHNAFSGIETGTASLYGTSAQTPSSFHFSSQLVSDTDFRHSQVESHPLSEPDSYPQISLMGGGDCPPGQRQVLGNDGYPLAINHLQNGHYRDPSSCMIELTVAIDSSAHHNGHTYRQVPGDDEAQAAAGTEDEDHINTKQEIAEPSEGLMDDLVDLRQSSEAEFKAETGATGCPRKRAQMSPGHRQQTAETRKRKACTRCRNQKMRCDTDPLDKSGPCIGCKSFCKTSKKTLHLTPCFRGKITDAVLFRSGGLGLTRRWNGTEMKDVGDRISPHDVRTIYFTQDLWKMAIEIKVVAFEPVATDVTARFWMLRDSDNDVRRKKELAPYCLFSIQETADRFEWYIRRYAIEAMIEQRTGPVKIAGQRPALLSVIEKTYMAAVRHFDDLKVKFSDSPDADVDREMSLLQNLFTFWFARRHATGSAYISGDETLGMKPETKDDTYPLFGRVSLPRMIVAQFDSINHNRLLTKYGKRVLSELEALMMRNQPRWWFVIYVCLFILLREASWLSEDRYRHARQNHGKRLRYSIPLFVQNLQEGCNNLLQHWHYYNCKPWPDPTKPWDRHKSFLSELSSEHYDLVMETMMDPSVQKQLNIWRRYKSENGDIEKLAPQPVSDGETAYQGSQTQYDWDHPFYWTSQLFEEQWTAHPTYQAEL